MLLDLIHYGQSHIMSRVEDIQVIDLQNTTPFYEQNTKDQKVKNDKLFWGWQVKKKEVIGK